MVCKKPIEHRIITKKSLVGDCLNLVRIICLVFNKKKQILLIERLLNKINTFAEWNRSIAFENCAIIDLKNPFVDRVRKQSNHFVGITRSEALTLLSSLAFLHCFRPFERKWIAGKWYATSHRLHLLGYEVDGVFELVSCQYWKHSEVGYNTHALGVIMIN